jgi:hypothetical protein
VQLRNGLVNMLGGVIQYVEAVGKVVGATYVLRGSNRVLLNAVDY